MSSYKNEWIDLKSGLKHHILKWNALIPIGDFIIHYIRIIKLKIMWFLKKKLSEEQIDSRLFEFMGAVQTLNRDIYIHSLNVLTSDLPNDSVTNSKFYADIINFKVGSGPLNSLTANGSRRKILYNSFENLLRGVRLSKKNVLNEISNLPHGFSSPKASKDITDVKFSLNNNQLKHYLEKDEIEKRKEDFSNFLLQENYDKDTLNDIVWHRSELTSDIVSGSLFAGKNSKKLIKKTWNEFQDSRMVFGKLSPEQKEIVIEKFTAMLQDLPFNNFMN